VTAARPTRRRQDNSDGRVRALARVCSPAACAGVVVADAPGVRHLAEQLRGAALLPPEFTAGLFGFGLGLLIGFALCYPPQDRK